MSLIPRLNPRAAARLLLAFMKSRQKAPWKAIHSVADEYVPKIKAIANGAFKTAQDRISQTSLKNALKMQNEHAVMSMASRAITATEKSLGKRIESVLLDTLLASGEAGVEHLPRLRKLGAAGSLIRSAAPQVKKEFKFDVTNPAATEWASKHAAELIKGISETTRSEIKDLVEAWFEKQFDVDQLAEEIGRIIGDDQRAEDIARTESMRAADEGQSQLWDQAVEAGLLTGQEQQEWIVTPDDRLCPICEPLAGQKVGLDEMFEVDGEEIDGPPAHPRCRCTIGLAGAEE